VGEGDMNAYCTHHDCADDADCPAGFTCGVTRDPHDICGATCSGGKCSDDQSTCMSTEDCQKGNNSLCGETAEPCIDPASFNVNGATYFEGSLCLLRKTCLKREPCMPCEHNRDCSLDGQQVCIPLGTETVCARFCKQDVDCYGDELCGPGYDTCDVDKNLPCPSFPPGCPPRPCINGVCASGPDGLPGAPCVVAADCPQQTCVPRTVCVPREGVCRTSGGGFCHHCVNDTDCGDADSTQACEEVSAGEFTCFDESFPAECPNGTDAECPTAPGGKHGECLDDGEGVTSADWYYHRCYFPFDTPRSVFTCWP